MLAQQTLAQPVGAFVSLPVGSYVVSLVVRDSGGRNASITQVRLLHGASGLVHSSGRGPESTLPPHSVRVRRSNPVQPCMPAWNVRQNFVVAGGSPTGTIAVISQPLSYAPASPGGATSILLDAQGSSPKPGTSITQYVWAVVRLPSKAAVANATGRLAQVQLPRGTYQLGLLVVDSAAGNAIAQKNVQARARRHRRRRVARCFAIAAARACVLCAALAQCSLVHASASAQHP